jgi:capsular exopolysaccharide synthesis family protein
MFEHRRKPVVVPATQANASKPTGTAPGLGSLLKALRKRWLLASFLSVTLSSLVVVALWYGLPPPAHEVSAIVHVSAAGPDILGSTKTGMGEFAMYQQGQKALITGRLVIAAALRDPKIRELRIVRQQSEPVSWLQRELKVDFKSGPEYMRLTLKGDNPEELETLVSAIVDAYLKDYATREDKKLREHLAQLRELQEKLQDNIRQKNERMKKKAALGGSTSPDVVALQQKYASEELAENQKVLLEVKSKLGEVELQVAAHKAHETGIKDWKVPEAAIEQELRKDSVLQGLIVKKGDLEKKLEELVQKAVGGRDAPALKPQVREVEGAQAAIDSRRASIRNQIIAFLREQGMENLKTTLSQANERAEFLKKREEQLETKVKELQNKTTKGVINQIDLEHEKQELAQVAKLAEQVGSRAETLAIEVDAPKRVTLVEEAHAVQEDPVKRRMKAAGAGGIGTFLLVLGLVAWREYRFRRVDEGRELTHELSLPLIGTVPALPQRRTGLGGRAAVYRELRGPLMESIDCTRTRLVHATSVDGVRVVMVTSAVPREGKTSLSSHLAASLARGGYRTLLIDGDLRLPSLHRVFELEPGPGLAEVLRVEAHFSQVIRQTEVSGLFVMPAGGPDLRAIQALSQHRLGNLIERLRKDYQYIVIDSAPILPVVDSLLLGHHVDGVIVSVLREISQIPVVRLACDRLTSLNIRLLGAVLNGAELHEHFGTMYGPDYGQLSKSGSASAPVLAASGQRA